MRQEAEAIKMIIAILLFVAAFFLMETLPFVALLCVMLGVLSLFVSGREAQSAGNVKISEPYGPQGPIIVEQKTPNMPKSIAIKVKPDWKDQVPFEYIIGNLGWVVDRFGHFFVSLFTGKKK